MGVIDVSSWGCISWLVWVAGVCMGMVWVVGV